MIVFLILLSIILKIVKSEIAPPKCPSNMIQSHKDPTVCYFFVANATSFDDAEKFCNQNNGNLAPVFDIFANFFISENAFDAFKNSQDFWIGGKSVNVNDGTIWLWNWQNSFPFYFDWDRGEPSKNGCMASSIQKALWSSQDCNAIKPFVCQIPVIIELCDPEWTYFKASNQTGMCYRYISQNNVTIMDAQNICLSQNANLASIHSEEENSFLVRFALFGTPEDPTISGVLIGLEYINITWKWLDGTDMNYVNWGPNRPIEETTRVSAFFYSDAPNNNPLFAKKWDNVGSIFYRFICKKKTSFASITEKLL